MDARSEAAAASNTSTFEPSYDLIQEDDCNTFLLYLPGFTKEQLKVQLTRTRILKISGRRPIGNNRLSSFEKEFPIAENCDTNKITAKFEDGILYVRQPKEEKKLPAAAAELAQKPAETPRPAAPAPAPARIDPRPRPPTPTPKKAAQTTTDDVKQTAPKLYSPPKPVQSKEEIKSAEKSSGKKEAELGKRADEKSGGDEKAAAAATEKSDRRAAEVEADYSKLSAASPAARLKAARKQMTNIVILLFVFGLGIYVSKMSWFSKRAED